MRLALFASLRIVLFVSRGRTIATHPAARKYFLKNSSK